MLERTKSFLIGGDGGGTGCRVAIADGSGHILAQAQGGPANATSDFTGAIANLRDALGRAAAQIGLSPSDLLGATAHFGLAGVMTPLDAARVRAEFPFAEICVTEDRVVAVEGALAGADGVVLALGTGTIIASLR
jgi:glucosamine kinase